MGGVLAFIVLILAILVIAKVLAASGLWVGICLGALATAILADRITDRMRRKRGDR